MSAVLSAVLSAMTVPGWSLRVAVGAVSLTVPALVYLDGAVPVFVALLVAVALVGAGLPDSPAAGVLIGGAGVLVAVHGGDPLRPEVLVLVPACHAVHVLAAVAAVVPPGARVRPAALRRPALRWAGVQAAVLGLAGGLALVPSGRNPATLELLALVAVVLLGTVAVVLVRRARVS